MVTAGLLLSLEAKESSDRLASMLSARDAVFPGSPEGSWLPVAVEAADDGGLRELHDWIAGLPGVAYVDVVHVSFDDALMFPPTLPT
ncbi:MAG: hypothetical protein KDN18_24125 [Verrucomicrobiae bacterium]|nr:hypothetical protein [Verrucomicrobiae bacterium]